MIRQRVWLFTIILIAACGPASAWGQQLAPTASDHTKASSDKGAQRTQSINFEDELIQGDVQKPDLMYLLQKREFNFKRLIKLRENFLPEMNQTSEDIGRTNVGTSNTSK